VTSPEDVSRGLGRRFVGHDPRNLNYLSRPLLDARAVVRKDTYWAMPPGWGFPLDQGNTPECTGFGFAHEAAIGPVTIPGVDTSWAHRRYLRNVEEDHKAGRFFGGGATVEATMLAAKIDSITSGYVWHLGLNDTIDALCAVGPQCLGTVWKTAMFDPRPDGLLRVSGGDEGGHFYLLVARVENHPRFGPGCWMLNSWGVWGVGVPQCGLTTGCAFVVDADLAILLGEDGESVAARDIYTVPVTVSTVYATKTSKVFHTAKHPMIRHDRSFASYADAVIAGLRPCKLCRPRP
jgi:hypothetical protein